MKIRNPHAALRPRPTRMLRKTSNAALLLRQPAAGSRRIEVTHLLPHAPSPEDENVTSCLFTPPTLSTTATGHGFAIRPPVIARPAPSRRPLPAGPEPRPGRGSGPRRRCAAA